jgi:hypothetical protein
MKGEGMSDDRAKDERMTKMTRRSAGRILLGVPLAAAAAVPVAGLLGARAARAADDAPAPEPAPTPLAKFLARQEEGLSSDERDHVRKDVTQLEESLKTLRDFKIGNEIPPAGSFKAMKSRRGRVGRAR